MRFVSPQYIHVVLPALPAVGRVRTTVVFANMLLALSYTVTVVTGTTCKEGIEAMKEVEVAPSKGKADVDFKMRSCEKPCECGRRGLSQVREMIIVEGHDIDRSLPPDARTRILTVALDKEDL